MKNYSSSKRLNMVLNTVDNLMDLLSNNTMMQNFGMTEEQIDQVCTTAIQQTARGYGVHDSTVYSKCVRELGFDCKFDFVKAVIFQMARVSNSLYYAITHGMTSRDNIFDVERALHLPFNYAY